MNFESDAYVIAASSVVAITAASIGRAKASEHDAPEIPHERVVLLQVLDKLRDILQAPVAFCFGDAFQNELGCHNFNIANVSICVGDARAG